MSVGGKTLIIVLHQKESFGVEETIRNLDFLLKDTLIITPIFSANQKLAFLKSDLELRARATHHHWQLRVSALSSIAFYSRRLTLLTLLKCKYYIVS